MRTFKGFNQSAQPCPVCNTNDDKECTLIPIVGSNEDGGLTYEAKAVHVDCLDLAWQVVNYEDGRPGEAIIFQSVEVK